LPLLLCVCLLVVGMAVPSARAADHHPRHKPKHEWCPERLRPCPLKMTRPHRLVPGLNDDWQVRSGDLSYAQRPGARTIRFPLTWATVQPRDDDHWNWSVYDRLFAAARSHGLGVILTPTDAPCWAHPMLGCQGGTDGEAQPPDPAFDGAWAEFIRQVVGRYPDLIGLEVWNEPNSIPFWAPLPDPERYTELLKRAYQASKSVRPDIPVVFGGLAPNTGSGNGHMDNLEFLRRAYDAGAAGYFNAIAIHPYPLPFNRRDYRQRTLRLIAAVRRLAWRRQHARLPLWATEIGISTAGDGSVTDPVQAQRLKVLYHLLARVPDLPVVVVHRLFDQSGSGGSEDGWGLLRSDLSAKPAYDTMRLAFNYFDRLPRTPPGSWTPPGERPSGSGSGSGSGGLLPIPIPPLGF
jgi:polysaccharide biosynthesis protein PslG